MGVVWKAGDELLGRDVAGHLVPTSWDRARTVLDDARRAGRHQPPRPENPH